MLDDQRDALSMPIQRDAMRTGSRPDVNTEDEKVVKKAGEDLGQLADIATSRSRSPTTRRCPRARPGSTNRGRATCSAPRSTTCPRASPRACSRTGGPTVNGVVQNDYFCIGRTAKNPALAHRFINYMLDAKVAYDNMVNFVGYTPPQNSITAESLIKSGLIPKSLTAAVIRPDQFAFNQQLLQLTVEGAALLGRGLVEVQGRLSDELALDLAAARAPGRRLADRLLPARVLRRHRGRLRQPEHALGAGRRSGTRSTGTSATCSPRCRTSADGGPFLTVFVRTFVFVVIALALALLIGYPVAYFAAGTRAAGRGSCCCS